LAGSVDVAARIVGDEVEDVGDVDGRQRLGSLVTHLADVTDRDLGQTREHPPLGVSRFALVLQGAHSMLMRYG
jgi:hypothetical protein